jgi:translocation and assembly module TamB
LQDQQLKVSALQLTGPGTLIGGDLAVDLERTLIDGALEGAVADLAAFAPLLPVALAGQLQLAARLEPAGDGQTVNVTVDGSGLQGDFGSLQSLSLRADVSDALKAPRIDADLTLDAFRQGETVVDQATLGARGGLDQLALTLSANGTAVAPFDLDSRAQLALGEAIRLRLERLQGRFADQPVRLAQPAELTLADARTQLAGLDLRYGDARLQASADLGPQQVSADATLGGLPLAMLGRFGAPPLSGQADARLQLSGAADNPRGTLTLEVTGLRADGLTFAELPPARFDLDAQLADRRLSVDLQGEGVTQKPLTLTAELPLTVRLDQFAFELPQDGRLSGRLDAELALARVAALAALDDQTLSGLMTVRGTVGGTVGTPQVQGNLDIADGAYANGETGTVLSDMTLNVRADARQVVIERFAATELQTSDHLQKMWNQQPVR